MDPVAVTDVPQGRDRGLVVDAGVREVADLREISFPVGSTAVSGQDTVKAMAGSVNVPVALGGQTIRPGGVVLADDGGVLCVDRAAVTRGIELSQARLEKEEATRAALRSGQLDLDRYGLRDTPAALGVRYLTAAEYAARHEA
jgi:4-hydroxy-4-methyl-2-oxoglutarate aldolase